MKNTIFFILAFGDLTACGLLVLFNTYMLVLVSKWQFPESEEQKKQEVFVEKAMKAMYPMAFTLAGIAFVCVFLKVL